MLKRNMLIAAVLCLFLHPMGKAQIAPALKGGSNAPYRLGVGGEVSVFKPDFFDNTLIGVGVHADYNFNKWIGLEGQARFLKFNQVGNNGQTTYALGPRVMYRRHRYIPYVKVLYGLASMDLPFADYRHDNWGFWDYGGGLEYHLKRKIYLRGEFDYQTWDKFLSCCTAKGEDHLNPYGASVGITYKLF